MGLVEDRLVIIETCTRMAWHADQREWDRLAGVFAGTVVLDYTSLNGGEVAELTPGQIVDAWSGLLGAFDATQHLVTNHLVTVEGDTAVCTPPSRPHTGWRTRSARRCGRWAAPTASIWSASRTAGGSVVWS